MDAQYGDNAQPPRPRSDVSHSLDRLARAHEQLAGATVAILDLLSDLSQVPEGFAPCRTPEAWLSWHLGLSARTARSWARAAALTVEYPALRAHLLAGAITLDHLAALRRYLTTENADDLIARAVALDAEELRLELNERLADPPAKPDADPQAAWFRSWWDDGRLGFKGEIPGSDGLLLETALLRLAADAPLDPGSGLYRDPDERMAEALVQLASEHVARDTDPDRATLVVHVAATDLINRSGPGWDAARRLISPAELDRLWCDARIQPALHDEHGITVGVGRTTRVIPAWLRRLVSSRDRGCRFPGCRTTRWVHCHHLREWTADAGPTNLDNLVSLCGFHHRLIHTEGWTIDGNPNADLTFRDHLGELHRPVRHRNASSPEELHRSIRLAACFRARMVGASPFLSRPPP